MEGGVPKYETIYSIVICLLVPFSWAKESFSSIESFPKPTIGSIVATSKVVINLALPCPSSTKTYKPASLIACVAFYVRLTNVL